MAKGAVSQLNPVSSQQAGMPPTYASGMWPGFNGMGQTALQRNSAFNPQMWNMMMPGYGSQGMGYGGGQFGLNSLGPQQMNMSQPFGQPGFLSVLMNGMGRQNMLGNPGFNFMTPISGAQQQFTGNNASPFTRLPNGMST